MLTWEKTGRTVGPEGTTNTYTAKEKPRITIESRKRHIPNANGVGTWDHTSFVVLVDGCEVRREEYSLKYAKDFAEKITLEEDLRRTDNG